VASIFSRNFPSVLLIPVPLDFGWRCNQPCATTAEQPGLEIDHLIEWGEHPIVDTLLHRLFSQHETQKLLAGPKPKACRRITIGGCWGFKPNRN
jgi:hypothetical protein